MIVVQQITDDTVGGSIIGDQVLSATGLRKRDRGDQHVIVR